MNDSADMHKLNIFSDKSWLPDGGKHVIMLYPFWGNIELPDSDPDKGRFTDWVKRGRQLFQPVDKMASADAVILPYEFSFEKELLEKSLQIQEETAKAGKRLIVFFNSDNFEPIPMPKATILRTSFFKSEQKPNEFAFPGWSKDFTEYAQDGFQPLPKTPIPRISYCGYVDSTEDPGYVSRLRRALRRYSKFDFSYGSYIRGKAMRHLSTAKTIECDFIIRKGFWAQGITDKHAARKEYATNMIHSPYALVARGAGNFSYRLYEVLSCGRIPVFINTDAVLPWDTKINWQEHLVWIEEHEIDLLGDKLKEFHDSLTNAEFIKLQEANRSLYQNMLAPYGFFRHLSLFLREKF